MNLNKTKERSRIVDKSLQDTLKVGSARSLTPNIEKLAGQKRTYRRSFLLEDLNIDLEELADDQIQPFDDFDFDSD